MAVRVRASKSFFGIGQHSCGEKLIIVRRNGRCEHYPLTAQSKNGLQGEALTQCPRCGKNFCTRHKKQCRSFVTLDSF